MKLTINKKEAELLEDISIDDRENTVHVSIKEDKIKLATINFEGDDKDHLKTCKQVIVGFSNGEIFIGYRNRYGNGHRAFPISALEKLLWEDGYNTDNMKLLQANKDSYKLS